MPGACAAAREAEPVADAVVRHIVTFGRVLREAGLEIGPGRLEDALRGLDAVELARDDDVYWALRQTLVSRREDLDVFDRAFHAWFLRAPVAPPRRPMRPLQRAERRKGGTPGAGPEIDGGEVEAGGWSEDELLRSRDFAAMSHDEFARARRLIAAIALDRPRRRTRRLERDARGRTPDLRRPVPSSFPTAGIPVERDLRRRAHDPS